MESSESYGRILAIDWGEKHIGIAISDETQTLARPLDVLKSGSRKLNAEQIAAITEEWDPVEIIMGVTYDAEGELTPSGRRANRLADALRCVTDISIKTVDEVRSTQIAKENKIIIGTTRKSRRGHLDSDAAAVFLQQYLDRGRKNG
jgi:putative Holliday junction resolvase